MDAEPPDRELHAALDRLDDLILLARHGLYRVRGFSLRAEHVACTLCPFYPTCEHRNEPAPELLKLAG